MVSGRMQAEVQSSDDSDGLRWKIGRGETRQTARREVPSNPPSPLLCQRFQGWWRGQARRGTLANDPGMGTGRIYNG